MPIAPDRPGFKFAQPALRHRLPYMKVRVRQSWRACCTKLPLGGDCGLIRPRRLTILITFGFSAAHQTGSYLYSYVSIRFPRQSLCACTSMCRFFRTLLPAWSKQRCPTSLTSPRTCRPSLIRNSNARHTVRHRQTPNPASPVQPANPCHPTPLPSKVRSATPAPSSFQHLTFASVAEQPACG